MPDPTVTDYVRLLKRLGQRLAETPDNQPMLLDDRLNDIEVAHEEFHRVYDPLTGDDLERLAHAGAL